MWIALIVIAAWVVLSVPVALGLGKVLSHRTVPMPDTGPQHTPYARPLHDAA